METTRRSQLDEIFSCIDPEERKLIEPMLDDVAFLEQQMMSLRELPFISFNPHNPAIQRKTEASKMYKELCANYANIIRILLNTLRKVESSAQDELLKRLEEFS